MFFKLILENANGDRVDMTGTISTSSYASMGDYRKAMPQFQADSYEKNR